MSQNIQNKAERVIDALRVNLFDHPILVPMSAVAEVVRGAQVIQRSNQPSCLHGWLQWRELEIPLVAVEELFGANKGSHTGVANALVINSINPVGGNDFYAFLLTDLPQPARVSETSDLQELGDQSGTEYQLLKVSLDSRELIIPNLDKIEALLTSSL